MIFTLSECQDGGILIEPRVTKPEVTFSGDYGEFFNSSEGYIKRCFEQAGKNLEAVVGEVKNVLQGKERFFLPVRPNHEGRRIEESSDHLRQSKGTFIFKNPLFDFEGNLVCDLSYNP